MKHSYKLKKFLDETFLDGIGGLCLYACVYRRSMPRFFPYFCQYKSSAHLLQSSKKSDSWKWLHSYTLKRIF